MFIPSLFSIMTLNRPCNMLLNTCWACKQRVFHGMLTRNNLSSLSCLLLDLLFTYRWIIIDPAYWRRSTLMVRWKFHIFSIVISSYSFLYTSFLNKVTLYLFIVMSLVIWLVMRHVVSITNPYPLINTFQPFGLQCHSQDGCLILVLFLLQAHL